MKKSPLLQMNKAGFFHISNQNFEKY